MKRQTIFLFLVLLLFTGNVSSFQKQFHPSLSKESGILNSSDKYEDQHFIFSESDLPSNLHERPIPIPRTTSGARQVFNIHFYKNITEQLFRCKENRNVFVCFTFLSLKKEQDYYILGLQKLRI